MTEHTCKGCDKTFREEDIAPYAIDAEGAFLLACRKCIGKWNEEFLKPIPFWQRYQEWQQILKSKM